MLGLAFCTNCLTLKNIYEICLLQLFWLITVKNVKSNIVNISILFVKFRMTFAKPRKVNYCFALSEFVILAKRSCVTNLLFSRVIAKSFARSRETICHPLNHFTVLANIVNIRDLSYDYDKYL